MNMNERFEEGLEVGSACLTRSTVKHRKAVVWISLFIHEYKREKYLRFLPFEVRMVFQNPPPRDALYNSGYVYVVCSTIHNIV